MTRNPRRRDGSLRINGSCNVKGEIVGEQGLLPGPAQTGDAWPRAEPKHRERPRTLRQGSNAGADA